MAPTVSKAQRTREFIIAKSADIFNIKGYAGTSMTDICEATGLTKGSVYGNFDNKEEVALAVFDYNYARLKAATTTAVGKAETFKGKLLVYGQVYKSIIKASAHRGGCPILNTAIEADDTNPKLKARAAAAVTGWKKHLAALIKQGMEAGEFKKQLPASQMAVSIVALIEGGVMMSRVTGDDSHMDNVLRTVESLIDQMER
jgi:TetR/AcrR family transcriptional repressor of nem operon